MRIGSSSRVLVAMLLATSPPSVFSKRRGGFHGDGFRVGADVEQRVDAHRAGHLHLQAAAHILLETGHSHGQLIRADR